MDVSPFEIHKSIRDCSYDSQLILIRRVIEESTNQFAIEVNINFGDVPNTIDFLVNNLVEMFELKKLQEKSLLNKDTKKAEPESISYVNVKHKVGMVADYVDDLLTVFCSDPQQIGIIETVYAKTLALESSNK